MWWNVMHLQSSPKVSGAQLPHDLMACRWVNVGSVSREIPMITDIVEEPSMSSCCISPSQNKSSKTRSSTLHRMAFSEDSLCDLNKGYSDLSYMGTDSKATATSLRYWIPGIL